MVLLSFCLSCVCKMILAHTWDAFGFPCKIGCDTNHMDTSHYHEICLAQHTPVDNLYTCIFFCFHQFRLFRYCINIFAANTYMLIGYFAYMLTKFFRINYADQIMFLVIFYFIKLDVKLFIFITQLISWLLYKLCSQFVWTGYVHQFVCRSYVHKLCAQVMSTNLCA
jgi:hypothetical protein